MKRPRADDEPQAGGLGDIMGGSIPLGGGPGSTVDLSGFTPLQRLVLTANGNLQRIVSSSHDAAVAVTIVYNRRVGRGRFERQVTLSVFGITFAVCTSAVSLERDDAVAAVESGGVAIGQLFRHLNIMPRFELHRAGRGAAGGAERECADAPGDASAVGGGASIWREYCLSGRGVCCEIREVVRADLFELTPPRDADGDGDGDGDGDASADAGEARGGPPPRRPPPNFGDIMSPAVTRMPLPSGFTPLQRVLLSANGNVARLVGSYFGRHVTTCVNLNHERVAPSGAGAAGSQGAVYDRQVTMLVGGRQFMIAKTTAYVTSAEWARVLHEEKVGVGGMFGRMGVLPTFTLHSAGRTASGVDGLFWRVYTLSADGMTCEINETFDADVFGGGRREGGHDEAGFGF